MAFMRDINEIMPKIPNMKWGALLNKFPTQKRVRELDAILPDDKRWHTVFDFKGSVYVDGTRIQKYGKNELV